MAIASILPGHVGRAEQSPYADGFRMTCQLRQIGGLIGGDSKTVQIEKEKGQVSASYVYNNQQQASDRFPANVISNGDSETAIAVMFEGKRVDGPFRFMSSTSVLKIGRDNWAQLTVVTADTLLLADVPDRVEEYRGRCVDE